ncbi:hypothetical protein AMAG_18204 [Allomyces macrogynus ATCC 38327]|uniref:Uncharacterized protein n=1 Tax=Allomyces macrogynus (strain ATCC 38327) TaxID=578462 RepID=A0A0L0SAU1_ALLM3|nr:hypothetical protein AMAG_18204 [Allomyces macrogynus ATCC 38327]|eukprot:KNE59547.1 hypothetical protein AMAG_18204 [Allomyces macrogynus ATCC 38327]
MGDPAALAAALSGRNAAIVAAATAAAQAVLSSYGRPPAPPPPAPLAPATTPTHATWARAQAQASEYAASIASGGWTAAPSPAVGGWMNTSPAVGPGAVAGGWTTTSPSVRSAAATGTGWTASPAMGGGAWSSRAYSPMPPPSADARSVRTDEGGGSVAGGASWHERAGVPGGLPPKAIVREQSLRPADPRMLDTISSVMGAAWNCDLSVYDSVLFITTP